MDYFPNLALPIQPPLDLDILVDNLRFLFSKIFPFLNFVLNLLPLIFTHELHFLNLIFLVLLRFLKRFYLQGEGSSWFLRELFIGISFNDHVAFNEVRLVELAGQVCFFQFKFSHRSSSNGPRSLQSYARWSCRQGHFSLLVLFLLFFRDLNAFALPLMRHILSTGGVHILNLNQSSTTEKIWNFGHRTFCLNDSSIRSFVTSSVINSSWCEAYAGIFVFFEGIKVISWGVFRWWFWVVSPFCIELLLITRLNKPSPWSRQHMVTISWLFKHGLVEASTVYFWYSCTQSLVLHSYINLLLKISLKYIS